MRGVGSWPKPGCLWDWLGLGVLGLGFIPVG